MKDRPLPQAIDIERSFLGACLRDNSVIPASSGRVQESYFYSSAHRIIWSAILEAYRSDKARNVDLAVLRDILERQGKIARVGGDSYLSDLEFEGAPAHAEYYATVLGERARARAIIAACYSASDKLYEGAELNSVETELRRALQSDRVDKVTLIRDHMGDILAFAEACARHEKIPGCVPFAWSDLQSQTGGLQPGHIIVVAGRPSMGKSSFAMNVAEHASENTCPVMFFSLEMRKQDLALGVLCSRAKVSTLDVRIGRDDKPILAMLNSRVDSTSALKLFLDDSSRTFSEIAARARLMKDREGVGLVIVDYLQLVRADQGKGQTREQVVAGLSRDFKGLASDLNVPVIIVAQLNRLVEGRTDTRPRLSDLRESGAIEQDADEVILLHRQSYYTHDKSDNSANVILAKQRQGPRLMFDFIFQRQYTRFEQAARAYAKEPTFTPYAED